MTLCKRLLHRSGASSRSLHSIHRSRIRSTTRWRLDLLSCLLLLLPLPIQTQRQPVATQPPETSGEFLALDQATQEILQGIPEDRNVLLLRDDTFTIARDTYYPLFVLFDSPTRNGSKDLFTVFSAAATAIRKSPTSNPLIRFGSLDVTSGSKTFAQLRILGLPAMVRFRCMRVWTGFGALNDSAAEAHHDDDDDSGNSRNKSSCSKDGGGIDVYTGGKTSSELQRFVQDIPFKQVYEVKNQTQLDGYLANTALLVLVVLDDFDNQAFFDCQTLAQVDTNSIGMYAVTRNISLLKGNQDEQNKVPLLVLYREFGAARVVLSLTGHPRLSSVVEFIDTNRFSAISIYSTQNAEYYYDPNAFAHVMLFSNDADPSPVHSVFVDTMTKMAARIISGHAPSARLTRVLDLSDVQLRQLQSLRFLLVPTSEQLMMNAFFVSPSQMPVVVFMLNQFETTVRFPLYGSDLATLLVSPPRNLSAILQELMVNILTNSGTTTVTIDASGDVDQRPPEDPVQETESTSIQTQESARVRRREDPMEKFFIEFVVQCVLQYTGHQHNPLKPRPVVFEDLSSANQQEDTSTSISKVWIVRNFTLQVLSKPRRLHQVVLFVSSRCSACAEAKQVFGELASEVVSGGTSSWHQEELPQFWLLDVDSNPEFLQVETLRQQIQVLPVLVFFAAWPLQDQLPPEVFDPVTQTRHQEQLTLNNAFDFLEAQAQLIHKLDQQAT